MQPLTWVEFIALGNRHNWPDGRGSDIGKLLETVTFLTDPGKHNIAVSREYMREIRALLKMSQHALMATDHNAEPPVMASGGEVAITQSGQEDDEIEPPLKPHRHGSFNDAFAGPCAACHCDDLSGNDGDANECGCRCHEWLFDPAVGE